MSKASASSPATRAPTANPPEPVNPPLVDLVDAEGLLRRRPLASLDNWATLDPATRMALDSMCSTRTLVPGAPGSLVGMAIETPPRVVRSMPGSSGNGRPLTNSETRVLQELEKRVRLDDPDFPVRIGSRPGHDHPPAREAGHRLRCREVASVLVGTGLYASILSVLPEHLILVAVIVVQLVVVPAACVIWARRHGQL